ncbi:chaperone modulator CbpM [Sphingobacterium sp. MYb382]|uniref:chaperone modulator CbpM n=1 Tax=Sphingobacterium sp. MYb382 TaxID=2745278 RepID=UPI0030A0F85D
MKKSLIRILDIRTSHHQLETSFLKELSESGLIDILKEKDEEYLDEEQLQALEQYSTWYYELEINMQGIQVARQLLQKIEQLQEEIKRLR